jgi:phenylacetate-CoA ligase
LYVNAFAHSPEQLKEICDKVSKNPNQYYFAGYASSLNVIAEFALDNGYDLSANGAISLGDKLFDSYKKKIKKAFKCKVFDTYGSNEGFMIAAQDDLDHYYILSPHVYIEILDDDYQPVPDGEMGNIIVTRLDCFSMPLIRYKLGDLGIILPKEDYPKERKYGYPLLKQVVGRETDIVVLPDNSKLVVHSFTGVFEYIPEIKQFKVIQEDTKGITIEYIKSDTFTPEALETAEKELRRYTKENFSIDFREVSYIAPTKSGKPQIVESRLKK